jgi:hypothetical protein
MQLSRGMWHTADIFGDVREAHRDEIGIASAFAIHLVRDEIDERKEAIQPQIPVSHLFGEVHGPSGLRLAVRANVFNFSFVPCPGPLR